MPQTPVVNNPIKIVKYCELSNFIGQYVFKMKTAKTDINLRTSPEAGPTFLKAFYWSPRTSAVSGNRFADVSRPLHKKSSKYISGHSVSAHKINY